MKAKWIDINIWVRETPAPIKSLHHLNIDNAIAAVLILWREGKVKEWRLFVPELFMGNWRDSPLIHLSDSQYLTVKAPNVETAKIRATNALVLRWQDRALAGIRLLNRIEEG